VDKILIIQTSFLGDVILATSLIESLHKALPNSEIHMLVRKGNEGLIANNPRLKRVWIWDKKAGKIPTLKKLGVAIRKEKFDAVINPHRFASSGFLSWVSGAKVRIGFNKNPLSLFYNKSFSHDFDGSHEIERNHSLISEITGLKEPQKPKLYPTKENVESIAHFADKPFVCMAPTSVWFTKQWPEDKWIELTNLIDQHQNIYLLGAPDDAVVCERIKANSGHSSIVVLAGKLNLLESAALMSKAQMNYVNDSGPMHLASATNAPTTAIYCSTIPSFGFGPLSSRSIAVELEEKLDCKPCGIHGHAACPKQHFKCGNLLTAEKVFSALK
jgi:lipopolysaccharide heptosyltransferase II